MHCPRHQVLLGVLLSLKLKKFVSIILSTCRTLNHLSRIHELLWDLPPSSAHGYKTLAGTWRTHLHKMGRRASRIGSTKCEISSVDIDPAKTALLIIDLQNCTMCKELRPDMAVPALFQAQYACAGLWQESTELERYLKANGIRILLFTGANTGQCVMGSLQDAHAQGYDTIFLKDGCATDSSAYAQQNAEFNCLKNWGFLSTCRALAEATS